jgi:hypothetical protein
MAISSNNIWYECILSSIRDFIIDEFKYAKIYIGPTMQLQAPFSIRIWSNRCETISFNQGEWVKRYFNEIIMYQIEKNPQEDFYKQFFRDAERLYQLLYSKNKFTTQILGGGGDNYLNYYDGMVESMEVNEFSEGEEEVDGLNLCRIEFNCTLSRDT